MEQQIKEFETLTELLEDLEREGITGYPRQKIMTRFLSERAIIKKVPYNGSFELTPLCNLDCKMCYVHLNKNQMDRGLLTTEQWLDIARQAIDAGMMNAEITGGECLTYPGFKDIYLYLRSRGIKTSILTNGVLMTEEMVNFFVKNRPELVQITLYGSCDDAYERITGHRVFQKVIDGIERLRAAKINVKVSVTPNRYTEDDLLPTVQLLRSMNIDYAVSSATLSARPETGRLIDDYAVSEEAFAEIQKAERDFFNQKNENAPKPERPPVRYKAKGLKVEGVPCGAGKNSFHVNWKGEMCPCIAFSSVAFPIGEDGFNAAWKKVNTSVMVYDEPDECYQCADRDICIMCPADRVMGTLGGSLNKRACIRLHSLLDAGIVTRE